MVAKRYGAPRGPLAGAAFSFCQTDPRCAAGPTSRYRPLAHLDLPGAGYGDLRRAFMHVDGPGHADLLIGIQPLGRLVPGRSVLSPDDGREWLIRVIPLQIDKSGFASKARLMRNACNLAAHFSSVADVLSRLLR